MRGRGVMQGTCTWATEDAPCKLARVCCRSWRRVDAVCHARRWGRPHQLARNDCVPWNVRAGLNMASGARRAAEGASCRAGNRCERAAPHEPVLYVQRHMNRCCTCSAAWTGAVRAAPHEPVLYVQRRMNRCCTWKLCQACCWRPVQWAVVGAPCTTVSHSGIDLRQKTALRARPPYADNAWRAAQAVLVIYRPPRQRRPASGTAHRWQNASLSRSLLQGSQGGGRYGDSLHASRITPAPNAASSISALTHTHTHMRTHPPLPSACQHHPLQCRHHARVGATRVPL